ncbi:MAG: type III secretion system chaperone [Rhodobacteraceae bacterium]|nr:type III secretion system chaperone [Paracoccaceae bacterium]
MISAYHALDTLARKLGLPALAFTDDQVGIDVTSDLTIFLSRLDDTTLEASCQLEHLGHPDAAMMQALLEANYLGSAVGAGRLALNGDQSEVILCESWNLSELDATMLESRFDIFANTAAFWLTDGTGGLLEQADLLRASRYRDEVSETAFLPQGDADGGAAPIVMRL